MTKEPYEIDYRGDLKTKAYCILVDGLRCNPPDLPAGLEGMVNHNQFVRSFSQGAQQVIIERQDQSDLVYSLQSDQIRGDQRWFLYKKG